MISEEVYHTNEEEINRAIHFLDGNAQVIAPAGASKTRIITERIKNIRQKGIKEGIIAFAFNENAAEELSYRTRILLGELLKKQREGPLFIGTQHKFCFEILKEYIPKYSDYMILEDSKRYSFFSRKDIYNRLRLFDLPKVNNLSFRKTKQNTKRQQILYTFFKSIDIFRDENLSESLLDDTPEFKYSYFEYQSILEEYGFLDFSALTQLAVKLLKKDISIKKHLLKKYKYLIVDEYQDINPIQEALIELFSENNCTFVVGDEDQCIYQFRGTNIDNILNFNKRYNKVSSFNLSINYRSTEGIVGIGNSLIIHNQNRTNKKIFHFSKSPNKYQQGDIQLRTFDNDDKEIRFIAKDIKQKIGTNFINSKGEKFTISYRDIAILVRLNSSANRINHILREEGIKPVSSTPGLLIETPEIRLIIDCIFYVYSLVPGLGEYISDEPLVRMYEDIMDLSTPSEINITENGLMEKYHIIFPKQNKDNFISRINNLKKRVDKLRTLSLQSVYHGILSSIGSEDFEFSEQENYNFGKFSELVSDFEDTHSLPNKKTIFELIEFLWGYVTIEVDEGGFEDYMDNDAVKVMTIHQAKGLEFPIVYLPHLVNDIFPWKSLPSSYFLDSNKINISRYQTKIEDERRLMYVAITRSQKYLILSYSKNIFKWSNKKSNESMFISELDKSYLVNEDKQERPKNNYVARFPRRYFKTSATDITYYDSCPYLYYLRIKFGFNPIVPLVVGYGKQVHKIINILHKEYPNTLPSEKVISDTLNKNFYMRDTAGEILENMKNAALKEIKKYIELNKNKFNNNTKTETPFEIMLNSALIEGSIDILSKNKNNKIQLMDLKTREEINPDDYKIQLGIYSIAALEELDLEIDDVELYSTKDGKTYPFDYSENNLNEIKNKTIHIINKILIEQNFKEKKGEKCKYCDMKLLCSKKML